MSKVKHIALLKFKDETPAETVDELFQSLLDVTEVIPGIDDYVAGANTSPEGLSKGFTHGFVMSFQDSASRDAYLSHPEHEKIKVSLQTHAADVVVFDFEV